MIGSSNDSQNFIRIHELFLRNFIWFVFLCGIFDCNRNIQKLPFLPILYLKKTTLQQFKYIKTGFVVSVLDLMNYHVDSYYIFFKICSNFHNIFYFDEIDLNPKTYVLPKNKWHTTYYFGKNSQNSNFFGHVEV